MNEINELSIWLAENKFDISNYEIENTRKMNIFYNNLELITLEIFEKKIFLKNPNEILYNKYLRSKKDDFENLKKYLEEFKKEIDAEENNQELSNEKDEKIEIYDSNNFKLNVREISQPIAFLTLMDYADRGLLVIPKNQRNYVWTRDQVENLAISLIRGFPIPPIYAFRNNNNQFVVLDGQQRLISLYLYYKERYLINTSKTPIDLRKIMTDKPQKGVGLLEELRESFGLREEKYFFKKSKDGEEIVKEISYNKLEENTKRVVDFRTINLIEIMVQGNDDKEEVFYEIFGNLNQGGTQLKNQELRNGIYQCEFYDMLHEINNNVTTTHNKKWRIIFGNKHRHSRDVELLLRFAATEYMFEFKNGEFNLEEHKDEHKGKGHSKIKGFKGSYPKLLNDFSKIAMNFENEKVNEFKNKICQFINRIETDRKIANLLLESLYLASIYIEGDYKIEDDFIKEIENSTEYEKFIKSSSSSKNNVKNRLEFVYKKLNERYGIN